MVKYFKLKFFELTFERYPNLFRPSSKPFISGDSFRNIANHVFDETKSFKGSDVKEKDIVFVSPTVIDFYFHLIHPEINNKYILITHNSDIRIGKSINKYLDEKIIHWYASNLDIKIDKNISLLPMGLENLRRLRYGRLKNFKNKKIIKNKLILCSIKDTPEFDEKIQSFYPDMEKRINIKKVFLNNRNVELEEFKSYKDYFSELRHYKFLICPPSSGFDTYRIWEGLLLDVFPIFEINQFTLNLKNLGVPGIYLENWKSLENFNEVSLNEVYSELIKDDYKKFVSYDYWHKEIINN